MLDSVEAVIQYASSMTWKGTHPVVKLVTTTYQTGVKPNQGGYGGAGSPPSPITLLQKVVRGYPVCSACYLG